MACITHIRFIITVVISIITGVHRSVSDHFRPELHYDSLNSRQYEHIGVCMSKGDAIILRRKIIKSTRSPVMAFLPILKTSCYRGLQLSHRTKTPLNCSMGSWAYYGPIRDNKSGLLFFFEFQELLTFPNVPMATCCMEQRRGEFNAAEYLSKFFNADLSDLPVLYIFVYSFYNIYALVIGLPGKGDPGLPGRNQLKLKKSAPQYPGHSGLLDLFLARGLGKFSGVSGWLPLSPIVSLPS